MLVLPHGLQARFIKLTSPPCADLTGRHTFETSPYKPATEMPLAVQMHDGIILVCGPAVFKFRGRTSSEAILARARDKWGPGMVTDKEGYEVTEESPVLAADQYEYQICSTSKTASPQVKACCLFV